MKREHGEKFVFASVTAPATVTAELYSYATAIYCGKANISIEAEVRRPA
jgi:hypothetical protein